MKPAATLRDLGALPLADRIAERHGARLEAVLTPTNRSPTVIRARHEFWWVLHCTLGGSEVETAHILGVDRATLRNALKKHETRLTERYGESTGDGI